MLLARIYPIAALLPTAATAFAIGFDKPLRLLWLLPIYLGYTLGFFILHFVVAYIWSLFLKKKPEPDVPSKVCCYITSSTINILNIFGGARIRGFDKKALPEGPFLIVGNHISNFDPIVTADHLYPRKSIFLSKESNFRAPIAGPFIRMAGYLCIDREDPRRAMEAVSDAVKRLEQGYIVGVYPEGTRSKDGQLGEFKDGIFLIAKKAKVPIVVVTVKGTKSIQKNCFRRFSPVDITLSGIIDVDTVCTSRTAAISAIAREMIEKSL